MATSQEEVLIRLGVDSASMRAGTDAAIAHQRKSAEVFKEIWRTALSAVGGFFTVEGIIGFGRELVSWTKTLRETSERLNVTIENVQRLNYAAEQSGVSIEKVASAFDKLAKAKEEAIAGKGTGQDSFAQFGISIDEIRKKTPEQLFNAIADSIARTGVNSAVTASAMALMGRNAGALIPMLAHLKELTGAADVLPEAQANDLESAGKFGSKMYNRLKVFAGTMLSPTTYAELGGGDHSGIGTLESRLRVQQAIRKDEIDGLTESANKWHEIHDIHVEIITDGKEIGKQQDAMVQAYQKQLQYERESLEIKSKATKLAEDAKKIGTDEAKIGSVSISVEEMAGRGFTKRLNRNYGAGGIWDLGRGDGVFGDAARGYLRSQKQMAYDLNYGNGAWDAASGHFTGQAEKDRLNSNMYADKLGAAGLDTPSMKMEAMKTRLKEISDSTKALFDLAKGKGITISVP